MGARTGTAVSRCAPPCAVVSHALRTALNAYGLVPAPAVSVTQGDSDERNTGRRRTGRRLWACVQCQDERGRAMEDLVHAGRYRADKGSGMHGERQIAHVRVGNRRGLKEGHASKSICAPPRGCSTTDATSNSPSATHPARGVQAVGRVYDPAAASRRRHRRPCAAVRRLGPERDRGAWLRMASA
jgi:hypothetical protein